MSYGRSKGDLDKLDKIKKCLKLSRETEADQRRSETEDLKFQVPELQWDDQARTDRKGRPILSVSLLDQPIQMVLNQERSAHLGVNIHPLSEDADDDTAEILQGLYRHIERDSRAGLARSWAFQRAVTAGRGAYRVLKEFDDAGGHPFDQKIVIKRILHQEAVYFDPTAIEPDWSDGKWALIESWLTMDDYEKEFPDSEYKGEGGWDSLKSMEPEWVRHETTGRKACLVAEYWYKEVEKERICLLKNGKVVVKDGKTKYPPEQIADERERDIVKVYCCKVDGAQVLDETEWDGKLIPIIPVIGRELIPIEGKRRWVGIINHSKDGQRAFNFGLSSFMERLASEPKTPWVMAEGQDEGHEDEWQTANVRNAPVLFYKPTNVDGQPVPPPQRAQLDSTGMNLAMMAMQEARELVHGTTFFAPPSLGNISERSKERSGRAVLALQQQTDAGTSDFMQNLGDVSMTYEQKVVLDLIPKVYDRAGRITRILRGDDDAAEIVMLNKPYVPDPQSGRPRPVQDPSAKGAKNYDLSKGSYAVSATIGKSFQTRLQQGAEDMGEILTARPELMEIIGDLYFLFRDFPGAKEISKRLAKLREMKYPGLGEGEDGQFDPAQAQVQIQTLQQQLQMAMQQITALQQSLETDRVKVEGQLQKAAMDNATKMQLEELKAQLAIVLEQIKQQGEERQAALEHANKVSVNRESMAHEFSMAQTPPAFPEYEGGADQPIGGPD